MDIFELQFIELQPSSSWVNHGLFVTSPCLMLSNPLQHGILWRKPNNLYERKIQFINMSEINHLWRFLFWVLPSISIPQ